MKGSSQISHTYDGQTYLFPEAGARDLFAKSPEKFVPAFGGDCIVCYVEHGERMAGSVKFSARHKGRIYLFPNDEIRQMFVANPEKYENADLAIDGNCVVCLVKGGQEMPGKPEFTAIYNGMRYLFPSDAERQMFLQSPQEFAKAVKLATNDAMDKHLVSFSGTTGCAACSYGLRPQGDPSELGLFVKTKLGEVYIIEGAHSQFPKVYADRFDSLNVAVTGKVVAERDGVRWVEPTELRQL